MKRRDFLMLGGATIGSFAAPSAILRAQAAVRGAVVIGVNKVAGNLPVLTAAADGAKTIAAWLRLEKFEVKLFVDDTSPVKANDIFDAIAEFVERGTLDQLVIFFSGHGFLNHYAEHWLLSHAPYNPNEAISLVESVYRAKRSGIPNVVFISDACRSIPDSLGASQVRGQLVFPNSSAGAGRVDVDKFLAALPGDPALELPVQDSVAAYEGIFTSSFLDAFKRPDAEMVTTLPNGTKVVPNRKLPAFLVREVQKRAQATSISLNQIPDADVVSSETTYIGKLAPGAQVTAPEQTELILEQTLGDYAATRLATLGVETRTMLRPSTANFTASPAEAQFNSLESFIFGETYASDPSAIRRTLNVSGATVSRVVVNPKFQHLNNANDEPGAFRLEATDGAEPFSVGVQFVDGSATVVAALPGFDINIVVQDGRVSSVSYLPSPDNYRWHAYQAQHLQLDKLRAAVATAAQFGVFRIEGTRETRTKKARELGDRIRILKGTDPTLGLYAAYAYDEADLIDKIRSVQEYMHSDLRKDLFDVALLSNTLSGSRDDFAHRVVPFCPMLSQGWALLRVKDVKLPPEIEGARDHLRQALWTTFSPRGADIVLEALSSGKVF